MAFPSATWERGKNSDSPSAQVSAESRRMNPLLQAFTSLATAGRSKTTVLKPLAWKLALLITATILAFHYNLPSWVGTGLAICTFLTVALHGYSYIYFMHNNPEMLRTENYSIQKIAIENGAYGDSLSGRTLPPLPGQQKNIQERGVEE
jgi:hypothetical protein